MTRMARADWLFSGPALPKIWRWRVVGRAACTSSSKARIAVDSLDESEDAFSAPDGAAVVSSSDIEAHASQSRSRWVGEEGTEMSKELGVASDWREIVPSTCVSRSTERRILRQ